MQDTWSPQQDQTLDDAWLREGCESSIHFGIEQTLPEKEGPSPHVTLCQHRVGDRITNPPNTPLIYSASERPLRLRQAPMGTWQVVSNTWMDLGLGEK